MLGRPSDVWNPVSFFRIPRVLHLPGKRGNGSKCALTLLSHNVLWMEAFNHLLPLSRGVFQEIQKHGRIYIARQQTLTRDCIARMWTKLTTLSSLVYVTFNW
ncbi:hypothetical protein LEMLEM_LOCUS22387, partial [Lemmus lemmus]